MYVCTWLTRVVRRCGLLFSTLLDILWTRLMISSSSHLHTLSSYFPPFSLHKMMSYQRIESSLFQLSTCCGFEKPQKPFYAAARSGSHIITYFLLTYLLITHLIVVVITPSYLPHALSIIANKSSSSSSS